MISPPTFRSSSSLCSPFFSQYPPLFPSLPTHLQSPFLFPFQIHQSMSMQQNIDYCRIIKQQPISIKTIPIIGDNKIDGIDRQQISEVMITYFEGLPSASNRTINRRGDYCHSPDTPLFKGNQKRLASLSLQKKSPRKALVKINKNRFPKDFFPPSPGFQSLPMSARLAKFGGLVNESKESNQQTLDTPAPSSRVTNFEEATLFNKTSFFGAEQLVSQTIQVGGDVRYFSNEKKSLSKSKQKGKLTAMPSMHKSSSHHFKLDDLYNCTFSRDFSSGLASPTKSIDCPTQGLMKYQSKEERQKQLKDSRVLMERDDKEQMKRRKKWSQFLNMELLVVDGECHPNEQGRGNFRLRKKALLSNRPASLLPKIYS